MTIQFVKSDHPKSESYPHYTPVQTDRPYNMKVQAQAGAQLIRLNLPCVQSCTTELNPIPRIR